MTDTWPDRTDLRLLAALQEDSRVTNLELAEKIALSPAQTLRRHRRLEELGFIKKYEALLDAALLDLAVVAYINVTMERGHIREVVKFKKMVSGMLEIQECYSVTGEYDYVMKVVAKDLKSLSNFLLDTLMTFPGVSSVNSSVCLDEVKDSRVLPLNHLPHRR